MPTQSSWHRCTEKFNELGPAVYSVHEHLYVEFMALEHKSLRRKSYAETSPTTISLVQQDVQISDIQNVLSDQHRGKLKKHSSLLITSNATRLALKVFATKSFTQSARNLRLSCTSILIVSFDVNCRWNERHRRYIQET